MWKPSRDNQPNPFLLSSVKKMKDNRDKKVKILNGGPQILSATGSNKTLLHVSRLVIHIWQCYDAQHLIDVTFKLSNPPLFVPAHRLILTAASPYFRNLFLHEENNKLVIEIDDIDSDTFERLVAYCYTGTSLITEDNAERILKGAMIMQLEDMVELCVDFLLEDVSIFTIKRLYELEHETGCVRLAKKIQEYEINNFYKISQEPFFLKFSAKRLKALVESDNLNVNSEEDVLDAVERWFNHNVPDRRESLPELMSCLRLTNFDVMLLLTRVKPLPGCETLAYKAMSWICEPLSRRMIYLKYIEPREGLSGNWRTKALMAIQTDCADSNHGYIYRFSKRKDTWLQWDKITMNATNFETILVEDDLYFIGGKIDHEAIKNVNRWNLNTKTWKRLPDMHKARYWFSVTELDEKIYVMGGLTNLDQVTQSVEVYTRTCGWKEVCGLITPRYGARAVTLNGIIYLIGGHAEGDLKAVESYDPNTDKWTVCAPLLREHYLPGVAVHNRHIYVIGGWTQSQNTIVERYDVQTDKWTKVCSLANGRWGLSCIFIDQQLWAVGGGTKSSYTNNVSVYDTKEDKWSEARALPKAGIYYSFTVSTTFLAEEAKVQEMREFYAKEEMKEKELTKLKELQKNM